MKKAFLLIIVGMTFLAGMAADDRSRLFWQNKAIESELALAKTNEVYFVINAADGTILFKAKGIVLRQWKMARFACRPVGWPIVITKLLSKEAMLVPKRKHIDPKKAEEIGSYELDSLESKDMPADFILSFENSLKIHISSQKEKLLSLLSQWEISLQQAIYEAAKSVWWAAFKPEARMIHIRLEESSDARTLCWSLSSGMAGLIIFKTD